MVTEKKTITTAIMALLISIGGVGMNIADNPDILDNYYICDVNMQTGEFARLSGTKYSAYPNELDNKGYVRCINESSKGTWHSVVEYSSLYDIDILSLIPKDDETIVGVPIKAVQPGKKYICPAGNVGCYEVE